MNIQKLLKLALASVGLSVGALALAQTTPPAAPPPATPVTTTATIQPVNVNTATREELLKIPGLGAKLVDAIIKSRPYKDEKDLVKKVKGIGTKNIVKFRPYFLYK